MLLWTLIITQNIDVIKKNEYKFNYLEALLKIEWYKGNVLNKISTFLEIITKGKTIKLDGA